MERATKRKANRVRKSSAAASRKVNLGSTRLKW